MSEAKKIRVMQLVYSLQMGGSEKVALDIASHLNSDRFDARVCALDVDGNLADELDRLRIPHHVFHRRGLEFDVCRRLYRFIKDNQIDVVHTHHFTQLLFAALPARAAGVRIVHTEHESFSYTQKAVPRWLFRPLTRLTDAVTVVGPEVANYFVRTAGLPRERITIIPNGVNVDRFAADRSATRRELGLNAQDLVIGTIGRLEPEKDQKTLLEVFRLFRKANPRSRLVIVGDGSMAEELRSRANQLAIAEATLFLGYRRDVAALLAAMDVFVLTSIREGLPVSVIEAMAAGKPVVVSNIGSVHDLVRDGENGLLAPPGDVTAFSTALERLINDPTFAGSIGQSGRRTVEESYSLPAVIRSYEQLYESAMLKTHVWN